MAAQLNIKDPVLIERVRDLADRRGQPVTATLRALVDREWETAESESASRLAEDRRWLDQLQAKVAAELPPGVQSMTLKEIMDSIYDEGEPDGFAR